MKLKDFLKDYCFASDHVQLEKEDGIVSGTIEPVKDILEHRESILEDEVLSVHPETTIVSLAPFRMITYLIIYTKYSDPKQEIPKEPEDPNFVSLDIIEMQEEGPIDFIIEAKDNNNKANAFWGYIFKKDISEDEYEEIHKDKCEESRRIVTDYPNKVLRNFYYWVESGLGYDKIKCSDESWELLSDIIKDVIEGEEPTITDTKVKLPIFISGGAFTRV